MDYIQNIRKKLGKDKIILNFTCGILNQSGKNFITKKKEQIKELGAYQVVIVRNNRCLKRW